MESNKSIHKSDEQKNLYKALVDAYESEKLILDTYGDTGSFKRHRDNEDKDKEPSAGSNRGSKRRRARKEPESTNALKEKTSKPTGDTKDKPDEETSQHPGWFQKLAKPPTPDHDWNKTLLAAHGPHLDWITVRRDDDKLYTFKECDFNRLRIQDIEDMLLLLVQGNLTNLKVEERLAFNNLNLTKPDTYKSDLKQRESYTAYSNPRGFIYQNKDKKNILMCIDELHKFYDGTLNDVRTALNDRLKGIQMKYLP
ncbi:hypothetical protein Tco_1126632 [Tanacetum coccineum]